MENYQIVINTQDTRIITLEGKLSNHNKLSRHKNKVVKEKYQIWDYFY